MPESSHWPVFRDTYGVTVHIRRQERLSGIAKVAVKAGRSGHHVAVPCERGAKRRFRSAPIDGRQRLFKLVFSIGASEGKLGRQDTRQHGMMVNLE